MPTAQRSLAPPPPVVALASWLIPGAGYWLLGERARAMIIGITILFLFLGGVLIGGIQVVDAPDLGGPNTRAGDYPNRILQKPWFVGQLLTGPVAIISQFLSNRIAADPATRQMKSHARLAEMGTLYTGVAGMLNLLAGIDACARATHQGENK